MHVLVLIERDSLAYASWPSLKQKNKIPMLSVQEVVNKYQGFEGELLDFFTFRGDITALEKRLDEYSKLKVLGDCHLLHVISAPSEMPTFLKDRAIKLGYDIGVCEEEPTIYSSIFHELIFGYFDELISYKDRLNERLLFPDRLLAEKYVETHNELSAQGKGVEDYMEMKIYEVWEQISSG